MKLAEPQKLERISLLVSLHTGADVGCNPCKKPLSKQISEVQIVDRFSAAVARFIVKTSSSRMPSHVTKGTALFVGARVPNTALNTRLRRAL